MSEDAGCGTPGQVSCSHGQVGLCVMVFGKLPLAVVTSLRICRIDCSQLTNKYFPLNVIRRVVNEPGVVSASREAKPSRRSRATPVLPPAYICPPSLGERPDHAPK